MRRSHQKRGCFSGPFGFCQPRIHLGEEVVLPVAQSQLALEFDQRLEASVVKLAAPLTKLLSWMPRFSNQGGNG